MFYSKSSYPNTRCVTTAGLFDTDSDMQILPVDLGTPSVPVLGITVKRLQKVPDSDFLLGADSAVAEGQTFLSLPVPGNQPGGREHAASLLR